LPARATQTVDRRAAEALRLFISDTIACMDTEDSVPKRV
jgi:hypothetical protein